MRKPKKNQFDVCLVGHPYAPIGMGEKLRCTFRALQSVNIRPKLADIYKLTPPDTDEISEFAGACVNTPSDINIFHINGDEVESVLAHLSLNKQWEGYNIIFPAWELSRYPMEWAVQLDRFDEIWAQSKYTLHALQKICKKPIYHMPETGDVVLSSFLSRRYFQLPESDYIFLFFFDVRSYLKRKNPYGVINAFRQVLSQRPTAKIRLTLKINGAELAPEVMDELKHSISDIADHVTLLQGLLSDNETKNLVRCCDCFVSLHRSEGFGHGMAEAMSLGKAVVATAYSGNMEYMKEEVSYNVGYNLIDLQEGDYPHYEDQVWAEPNVDDAIRYMTALVDNPNSGRVIGQNARQHMFLNFSYKQIGSQYLNRLESIFENIYND
jgi:glycosyltransferase involved in cell wall biosynthesis